MHLVSIGYELKYNLPWMSRKVYNSPLPSRITLIVLLRQNRGLPQWWRVCLPMQETWVRSQIQGDSTCCRATKPIHHNC